MTIGVSILHLKPDIYSMYIVVENLANPRDIKCIRVMAEAFICLEIFVC